MHRDVNPVTADKLIDAITGDADLRAKLEALRDHLADQLIGAPYREQAPIAAQLRQVLIDLDGLPFSGEASRVDELARQRAARQRTAAVS